jgi:hypothetical protein
VQVIPTRQSKYQIVGEKTASLSGTLMDVGARDCILKKYLKAPDLQYFSSDIEGQHDFLWNLEESIPCEDKAYDIVTALDVLEHLEHLHDAFHELLRITNHKRFIGLPNMTCLYFRWRYLCHGHLNGKYELHFTHQGDRHRWLTTYRESCALVQHMAKSHNCDVIQYNITGGFNRFLMWFNVCR